MNQLTESQQSPIGVFLDLDAANRAIEFLQETGFPADRISLVPQRPDSSLPIRDTQAWSSMGGGAIAGTAFGGIVGLLMGYLGIVLNGDPTLNATTNLIGVTLAGSGIGAAAGSLLGLGAGVQVPKQQSADKGISSNYLMMLQGTVEEATTAQQTLREKGIEL